MEKRRTRRLSTQEAENATEIYGVANHDNQTILYCDIYEYCGDNHNILC
jgi:hypothetical protein